MKPGKHLQQLLSKKYTPSSLVEMDYKGNDLMIKVDKDGNAVLFFIGQKTEDGVIKGERYARTLKHDRDGKIIKDHWELKGKAT